MYKKVALKYGIDCIGVTSAEFYNEKSGENFKSVLVALFPYYANKDENSNLSFYCRSLDYHKICTEIMDKICVDCNFKDYKIFCDNGLYIDRELANQAGLGFYGKNSMLINEKHGSFFFIAYALLNEELVCAKPLDKSCMGCNKCINACPNGAIGRDGKIDEKKCVSYITQKKGALTPNEEKLVKECSLIFGCDVCQNVCPHNKDLMRTQIMEFLNERIERLSLCDIEGLSNKQFKQKYGKYAFAWRGKNVLERNLKILDE